jgi:hypothetical protein
MGDELCGQCVEAMLLIVGATGWAPKPCSQYVRCEAMGRLLEPCSQWYGTPRVAPSLYR